MNLDLRDQAAVAAFFSKEKPDYVFLAAAKVGGIVANNTYRADFIYENMMIQSNVIHQSYLNGVKKLMFLGSSCIYPRDAAQPMAEEAQFRDALSELAKFDERKTKIIELRYFGGLDQEEIGLALGISPATIRREQRKAEIWLRSFMSGILPAVPEKSDDRHEGS